MTEMDEYAMIVAPGCQLWDSGSQKWRDRLMTPLTRRMHDLPEIKLLVVHLGTNDEGKCLDEFSFGVHSFINQARYLLDRVEIMFSEVLPRCPEFRKYNENGRAETANSMITKYNQELEKVCRSHRDPRTGVLKHTFLGCNGAEAEFYKDSVHLSTAGARLLARELCEEISRRLRELDLDEKCVPRSTISQFWRPERPGARSQPKKAKSRPEIEPNLMSHDIRYRDRPEEIAYFRGDRAVPYEDKSSQPPLDVTTTPEKPGSYSQLKKACGRSEPQQEPKTVPQRVPATLDVTATTTEFQDVSIPPWFADQLCSDEERQTTSESQEKMDVSPAKEKEEYWSPPRSRRGDRPVSTSSPSMHRRTRERVFWSSKVPESERHTDYWKASSEQRHRQPSATCSVPPERRARYQPDTRRHQPYRIEDRQRYRSVAPDRLPSKNAAASCQVANAPCSPGNIVCTIDRKGNKKVTTTAATGSTRATLFDVEETRHVDGPTPNRCVFRECYVQSKPSHNMARHFFTTHLPFFLRQGDGFDRMNCWAKLFLRLLRHFDLKTIDELYERVLARGWFPVNRSTEYILSRGMTQSKQDKVMVRAFAEYVGIEPPTDFSETQPKSPAMLINWRILRCIMQFGMTAEERRRVCKFDRPPKGSNFTIPRRR